MNDVRNVTRVGDVMTTHFVLVDGRITVAEAVARLRDNEVKALLVDKRHADDEYGIVLLSDIARQVLAKDRAPERVNVYEIMSKPVLSVPSTMDIRYCARLFDKFGLTLAPVIDDGPVLGIVTYSNMVLRGLARDESTNRKDERR